MDALDRQARTAGWLYLLLVICLPLQLVGLLRGPLTQWMWLPMFFF